MKPFAAARVAIPMERAQRIPRAAPFETLAGFDDPLDMLLGCHRRIEKKLAALKALSVHLAANSVDAQASAAAQAVLHYFQTAAAYHHEDEEEDLFPALERRIEHAAERRDFAELRARLVAEHREMERAWARLRKPLESIADGLTRALPQSDVQAFVALYERHLAVEEAALHALERRLTEADRDALGRAMAVRRGASFSI